MKKITVKLILILSFMLVSQTVLGQGSWDRISSPTENNLRSVYFVDSLYGWAVGDSGTVIHTSNGGGEWNVQTSNTMNDIVDVFFLDREIGWAIEWNFDTQPFGTVILSTTNGGSTWLRENYREEYIIINSILFLDASTGWMVGNPHTIVNTTDGGLNWKHAFVDTVPLAFFPVVSIAFYDENYGYACGGQIDIAGVMWSTSDGGDSWQTLSPTEAPPDPILEIHIIDSLNVIGLSGDIEGLYGINVIRTSNGGELWTYDSLTYRGVPTDIDFRSETEVWAPLPIYNEFLVSTDAGMTWEQSAMPDSAHIVDVMFVDSLTGFAVGEYGSILKYVPPIVNKTEDTEIFSINNYYLEQNYPNPFNPVTTIRFTIPDLQYTTLKVYDVLGNVVSILVQELKKAGTHEVVFRLDNSDLPSGVYFYQLIAGNFSESKKMLLLK